MKKTIVPYKHKDTDLEGFIVYPETISKKTPAVILCHSWEGRNDFVCEKAELIASWGYIGFALDMYGKGILGHSKEENSSLMTPFIKDRLYLQERLFSALNALTHLDLVDNQKIASIGFCFGGLCALDFARSGAPLKSVVSVHGILTPPKYSNKEIKAKVLALHGYDDPMVSADDVLKFEKEMSKSSVDWQVHTYGGTMHAFTNPQANDPSFGTVYNPIASARAWQSIHNFLKETL